ncbi:hypothetical protein JOL79_02085 [Microbispora sp. RL4-1S]|uniref:RlpA-like protein double-psi beta-barrel domain-containing protein n=1 Tax=Microbispora oryzae TaxID=2806554 RepID=A0A940WBT9_9ACTN|nr:hypothetical protein [Microbispora oryzae]MBP2702590.1 hypothetical protein [Microbispora oryzae]
MRKRARQALTATAAGTVLVCAVTAAHAAVTGETPSLLGDDTPRVLPEAAAAMAVAEAAPAAPPSGPTAGSSLRSAIASPSPTASAPSPTVASPSPAVASPSLAVASPSPTASALRAMAAPPSSAPAASPAPKRPALPAGVATATSFWDGQTASGRPMRYETVASPYWPLGTTVKITYRGRSAKGVVEDFGPAEWAVAQHDIPAILDLSEEMMADLTGTRSDTVHVRFQVLKWGKGGVYRHSGTGYGLAMGKEKG